MNQKSRFTKIESDIVNMTYDFPNKIVGFVAINTNDFTLLDWKCNEL